jgi:hypothetical protein
VPTQGLAGNSNPYAGGVRGNHTLASSPLPLPFMSLLAASKRGCPPLVARAALRPALATRGMSSLPPSLFANRPVAPRLVHTSTPEPVPTSTTSPTEPITSLAIRGSNQHSLETPSNKAGTSPPQFHFHPRPSPGSPRQNMFSQPSTNSSIGVVRAQCGP